MLGYDENGNTRGYAHIEFPSEDLAEGFMTAIEERDLQFGDRIQRVDLARARENKKRAEGNGNPPSTTLFIGSLLYSVDEADIRQVLERFGPIKRISIGASYVVLVSAGCLTFFIQHTTVQGTPAALRMWNS